jgi:group I intron endonuclease
MPNQYTKNTFKDKCEKKGVDYWTALKRREAGMSEDRVFYLGDLKKLRKTNPITINEITYPNLKEAVRQLKPKASRRTIARKLKNTDLTPEEVFAYIPNPGYASGIIYLITNKTTKKEYVGVCIRSIEERWSGSNGHVDSSKKGKYTNKNSLQTAIREYGEKDFWMEEIDNGSSIEDLAAKEIYWIDKLETLFPNGYNLNKGGSIGGSNKQPYELDGIKFESKSKADEYIAKTRNITLETAKSRRLNNRIDCRTPSKPGEGVYKRKSYRAWSRMKSAVNPNSRSYIPGIKLCDRWILFKRYGRTR